MKILLIQLKRIGDLILTTPAIGALRKKFPDAELTLAISSECAALVPALEGVDRVLIMRRGLGDARHFLSVAKTKFDYCIDFTRNDRSASLALLSRARKRIVSHRLKRRSKMRRHAYNEFVQHRMHDMHMIEYNLSLLGPLEITNASAAVHLHVPRDSSVNACELRNSSGIGDQFAIFHPGSARAEKFWEPERWADLIAYARAKWKIDCVLSGGNSALEQEHISRIKNQLSPNEPASGGSIVDLSGRTDLLTLLALISQARLLVTVDSAPVHMAAATGTPQVALFGPTNPFHWRPRESPAHILQGESATPLREFAPKQPGQPMKEISTQAVIDAMDSLLSSQTV